MRNIDVGTKTTSNIVKEALYKFSTENLMLAIPCEVTDTSKYEDNQVVSVQPLISDIYEDGVVVTPRVIKDVFVKLQSGGGFSIKLPIDVGDLVTLHYTHRDLGDYISGDGSGIQTPISLEGRNFFCTYGFGTKSNNQSPSRTDLVIEGENTVITIKPSGEITTETNGKVTLKTPEYYVDTPTTTFTGNVQVNGDTNVSGEVTTPTVKASSSLQVAGAEVKQHDHSGQVPPLS